MKKFERIFPYALAGLVLVLFVVMSRSPSSPTDKMDLVSFGRIPVQHGGRIQPLDSLARNTMMIISGGKSTYDAVYNSKDEKGEFSNKEKSYPAIRWLIESMTSEHAATLKVFRVDSVPLRQLLDLPDRPGSWKYSFKELMSKQKEFVNRLKSARAKDKEQRNELDHASVNLDGHLQMFMQIARMQAPGIILPQADSKSQQWSSPDEIDEALERNLISSAKQIASSKMQERIQSNDPDLLQKRAQLKPEEYQQWIAMQEQDMIQTELRKMTDDGRSKLFPQATAFRKMIEAYDSENVNSFNLAVHEYLETYGPQIDQKEFDRSQKEFLLNNASPFLWCQWLYILVAVLAALSWLGWNEPLRRSAFWLAVVTFSIHTLALIARIYISGRPPVTNLYSSSVFIGWGTLICCLFVERIYRNGVSMFVAGALGTATMVIAKFLSANGDTLEMLQAVLDTNFWLATHVTTVALGYMATYVAGVIALIYVFAAFFTSKIRGEVERTFYQMMYGVVCFATLLSFTGTVLGGIWADESWGRFWGWDPKENGAVLIVIWNTLILHARWAGLIKVRGFANLAMVGNMVTTWSWFGTNQLGVGLHAYGFSKDLANGCAVTWCLQLLILGLGLLPRAWWGSLSPVANSK